MAQMLVREPIGRANPNICDRKAMRKVSNLMSKKSGKPIAKGHELRPQYDLTQLRGGVRGKYLQRYRSGTNLSLLEPDVRRRFRPMRPSIRRFVR